MVIYTTHSWRTVNLSGLQSDIFTSCQPLVPRQGDIMGRWGSHRLRASCLDNIYGEAPCHFRHPCDILWLWRLLVGRCILLIGCHLSSLCMPRNSCCRTTQAGLTLWAPLFCHGHSIWYRNFTDLSPIDCRLMKEKLCVKQISLGSLA